MRVAPEQIERANLVNLPDFLRSQGFALKQVGREYILQEHDSLHIKDNKPGELGKWFRFSENKGGNNIQFVQEFMGLPFLVNEHVLIPRQDTEVLVEQALCLLEKEKKHKEIVRILDLCTGSGCILLSMLHYVRRKRKIDIYGVGSDISKEALAVAVENAKKLGIEAKFVQGDLFENVEGSFDMILSNPPYIRTSEIERLQEEVRFHDPIKALDGKEDGLYFYRIIVKESRQYLKRGGWLIFEIGSDQAEAVKTLLQEAGYENIEVKKDLAGLDRVVYGMYS